MPRRERSRSDGDLSGKELHERDFMQKGTRDPRYFTTWERTNRQRGIRPVIDPEKGPENK